MKGSSTHTDGGVLWRGLWPSGRIHPTSSAVDKRGLGRLGPLTSPTLLSHRTPTRPGEEGDCFKLVFYTPSLPVGGSAVGERGKGE